MAHARIDDDDGDPADIAWQQAVRRYTGPQTLTLTEQAQLLPQYAAEYRVDEHLERLQYPFYASDPHITVNGTNVPQTFIDARIQRDNDRKSLAWSTFDGKWQSDTLSPGLPMYSNDGVISTGQWPYSLDDTYMLHVTLRGPPSAWSQELQVEIRRLDVSRNDPRTWLAVHIDTSAHQATTGTDSLDLGLLAAAARAVGMDVVKLSICSNYPRYRGYEALPHLLKLRFSAMNTYPELLFLGAEEQPPGFYFPSLRVFECHGCRNATSVTLETPLAHLMPAVEQISFVRCTRLHLDDAVFRQPFPNLRWFTIGRCGLVGTSLKIEQNDHFPELRDRPAYPVFPRAFCQSPKLERVTMFQQIYWTTYLDVRLFDDLIDRDIELRATRNVDLIRFIIVARPINLQDEITLEFRDRVAQRRAAIIEQRQRSQLTQIIGNQRQKRHDKSVSIPPRELNHLTAKDFLHLPMSPHSTARICVG